MVEIEKPRIECIDSPEDSSYGKYVVEPPGERIRYDAGQLPEKDSPLLAAGHCGDLH